MSILVITDLAGTGELTNSLANGRRDVIEYLVRGLPSSPYAARSRAETAPGIPRLSDVHPVWPELRVTNISVTATSEPATKRVRVEFSVPTGSELDQDRSGRYGPIKWEGSTRIFTESTFRDWRDNLMVVQYQGRPVVESRDSFGNITSTTLAYQWTSRVAKVDVDRPLLQLVGKRWERDNPEARGVAFTNVVNASRWRGYAPQAVLAEGFYFTPDTAGGYQVEYQFAISPDTHGWRYENSITFGNQLPADATEGNGIQYHEVYPPVSFAALELDE